MCKICVKCLTFFALTCIQPFLDFIKLTRLTSNLVLCELLLEERLFEVFRGILHYITNNTKLKCLVLSAVGLFFYTNGIFINMYKYYVVNGLGLVI